MNDDAPFILSVNGAGTRTEPDQRIGATDAKLPHIFTGPCNLGDDLTGPSEWTSPDKTTCVWYMGDGDFRIQTHDHRRAARLRRMTRVDFAGECVVGPFMQLFNTDRAKLRTQAMLRLLWGRSQPTPTPTPGDQSIGRESAAGLATVAPAAGSRHDESENGAAVPVEVFR